jgi:hypothetical protein
VLRVIPKFMTEDKDGKLRMKRELKLGSIPVRSRETSSIYTDSSMVDVSLETVRRSNVRAQTTKNNNNQP